MAAPTIAKVGSNAVTAANASIATAATVTATTANNDWLVVVVAAAPRSDNPTPIASCSDSVGNVYTLRAEVSFGSGAAGDGAALTFFTAPVTVNITSGTVTATGPDPCNERCIQVFRVRPAAGTISFITADGTGVGGNLTNHAAATVSVTNGNTIFGAAALETNDSVTGDSDTTNGSWSAVDTDVASGTSDAESLSAVTQYKTVTATGNQSWACSTTSARQGVCSYLVIKAQTAALTIDAVLGQYTMSGTSPVTPRLGHSLVAGGSSYALTGTAATFLVSGANKIIGTDVGSYALTGTDVVTTHGYISAAGAGSYALTGTDVTFRSGKAVAGDGGSYVLTGTDATLIKASTTAKVLVVDGGSYSLTGTDATLLHAWRITAGDEAGAVASDLLLETSDHLLLETGDLLVLEEAAGVITGGIYALTGSDATLVTTSAKSIVADAGSYLLTGTAATLTQGAVPAPPPTIRAMGEPPEARKKRKQRDAERARARDLAARARTRFKDAIGRLLEGLPPEFEEPEQLAEAEVRAVEAFNLLRAMQAPAAELVAVSELIDHIRQLRIAQPIAQLHLAQAYNQAHRHLMAKAQEDAVMALLLGE